MQWWLATLQGARWSVFALGMSYASLAVAMQAQSIGPEALVEDFVSAWNTNDAKAFGDLFSEDAHWIPVSGLRVKGRGQIQSVLGKEPNAWARTTVINAADVEVQSIGSDLALVLFTWEIVRTADADGKTAGSFRGHTMMVTTRRPNCWIVIAGQVASAPSIK